MKFEYEAGHPSLFSVHDRKKLRLLAKPEAEFAYVRSSQFVKFVEVLPRRYCRAASFVSRYRHFPPHSPPALQTTLQKCAGDSPDLPILSSSLLYLVCVTCSYPLYPSMVRVPSAVLLTLLEVQSRFGSKPLKWNMGFVPQTGLRCILKELITTEFVFLVWKTSGVLIRVDAFAAMKRFTHTRYNTRTYAEDRSTFWSFRLLPYHIYIY